MNEKKKSLKLECIKGTGLLQFLVHVLLRKLSCAGEKIVRCRFQSLIVRIRGKRSSATCQQDLNPFMMEKICWFIEDILNSVKASICCRAANSIGFYLSSSSAYFSKSEFKFESSNLSFFEFKFRKNIKFFYFKFRLTK